MRFCLLLTFFSFLALLQVSAQTTIGLIAHYPLDSTYRDITGNTANTATATGSPYFTCGARSGALRFNGQNDRLTVLGGPVNNEFDDEDITVSLYMKPLGGDGSHYVLSKRSQSCFGGNEFFIRYVPNTRTVNAVFLDTPERSVSLVHQLDNTACWQHIAVVREGGRVRLFVNGELVQVRSTAMRIDVRNDGPLVIGNSDCKNATERGFNGLIDELRVYNRALSEQDIRALYFRPDQIQRTSQVVNLFLGNSFDIELTNTCATSFSWSPIAGVSDPNAAEPTITPPVKGETLYTVAMADTIGTCIARDSILLNVIDPDDLDCNAIFLPNAFSPNGDGLNEDFGISNPFAIQELISFEIFDRWGNRMFQTANAFDRWDGSYRGQPINPGVVRYVLRLRCDGAEKVLTGNISVIR
jgi:gliding motility-associated-like protein